MDEVAKELTDIFVANHTRFHNEFHEYSHQGQERVINAIMAWHTRHSQPRKVSREEIEKLIDRHLPAVVGRMRQWANPLIDDLLSLLNGEQEKKQSVRSEIDQKFVQFETHLRGGFQHYAQFYPDCEACHPRPADA